MNALTPTKMFSLTPNMHQDAILNPINSSLQRPNFVQSNNGAVKIYDNGFDRGRKS